MANVRTQIDIDINTSAAAAGLRSLQSQINAFNTALQRSNKGQMAMSKSFSNQLIESVNASKYFAAEMVRMQSAAGALDTTLSKGQVTMKQFFSQKFIKDGLEASRVLSLANARAAALQTQFVATSAAANGFRDAVAIRPLEAFNQASAVSAQRLIIQRAMLQQATTSMINFGKNTQWAGRQLMVGFTVPLTIFGAVAGKTFMDLEKQAVNFKKVYGDAFTPPAELEANLKAVMELGKEYTKYGIALKDTVGLAAEAAAAGAQNKDLIDATTQATRLATLGQMEQNEALETTIALQNAFKLTGDDLAKSINFLNMVENQTVVTLQDLSAAIPRVAPVIKGLGGDVEDLAAFMAAMQEGGVSAEQGANALKSGLASLINPTTRAKERLDQFGISLDSIIMANKGDLMGTVQAFADALDTLDQFSRQQALEEVFGKFQYARLGALFDNINKDGTQAARTLELAGMSAAEMAASAEKELSAIENAVGTKFVAAMERLKAEIAPIGELFIKMATPIVNFLTTIAEKFNNLPDFAKKFILFGTVITGIVIPAGTMFLGLLMNLIGTLTKFGHLTTIFVKGLAQGGIRQALQNVTQATQYMTLAEIDATNAARQLSGATLSVNAALTDQVGDAAAATAAISALAGSYANLAASMRGAAALAPSTLGLGAGAMRGRSIVGKPLPIVKRNRGGSIPYFGAGDTVPGSGNKDTVPAMLTPGEFIVNKEATAQNFDLLTAINDGNNVEYRNRGGGIATTGRRYYGRFPSSLAAARAEAAAAAQAQRDELSIIQALTGSRGLRSTSQSTSLASRSNLFDTMVSRDTKPGQMIKILSGLGMRPEEFGLRSVGNYVLALSNRANDAMKRGVLSKQALLSELNANPGVAYGPIASQVTRYFGRGFDSRLFDTLYRQELGRVRDPISDATFRKLSRNALRRYLDSSGFDRNQRKSFLRDIVAGDTVRGGASVTRIKQVLAQSGVPFTQSGDDVYATVGGRQYNFGQLTAKSLDDLGRPSGISSYRDLQVPAGMVRAHANKGGGIATPGRMFYGVRFPRTRSTFVHLIKGADTKAEMPEELRIFENLFGTEARPISAFGLNIDNGASINERLRSEFVRGREFKDAIRNSNDPFKTLRFRGYSDDDIAAIRKIIFKIPDNADLNDNILNDFFREKINNLKNERLLTLLSGQGYRLSRGIGFTALKKLDNTVVYREYDPATGKGTRHVAVELTGGRIASYNTRNISTAGGINQTGGQNFTIFDNYNAYEKWVKQQGRAVREGVDKWPTNPLSGAKETGIQLNKGNIVPGVGNKDTVPAMLTPGEFVVNKQATRQNMDLLRSINNGEISGYNKGGGVARHGRMFYGDIDYGIISGSSNKVVDVNVAEQAGRKVTATGAGGRGGMMAGLGIQMLLGTAGFMGGSALGEAVGGETGSMIGGITGSMAPMLLPNRIGRVPTGGILPAVGQGGAARGAIGLARLLPVLANPIGLAAAAVAGLTAAFIIYRKTVDNAAKAAADFGANLGVTANALQEVASIAGTTTPLQRKEQLSLNLSEQEKEIVSSPEMLGMISSESGQKFIGELKDATSSERFKKLSDYLKYAIATGIMDKNTANAFAKAVSFEIQDTMLASKVVKSISDQAVGSEGLLDITEKRAASFDALAKQLENEVDAVLAQANQRQFDGQMPEGPAQITSGTPSKVVGAALQGIRDYAEVQALLEEELRSGVITYNEYSEATSKIKDRQDKYSASLEASLQYSDPAVYQAAKEQLISMGHSAEDFASMQGVIKENLPQLTEWGTVNEEAQQKLEAAGYQALAMGTNIELVNYALAELAKSVDGGSNAMSRAFDAMGNIPEAIAITQIEELGGFDAAGPQQENVIRGNIQGLIKEGLNETALVSMLGGMDKPTAAQTTQRLSTMSVEEADRYMGGYFDIQAAGGTGFAQKVTSSQEYLNQSRTGDTGLRDAAVSASSIFGEDAERMFDLSEKMNKDFEDVVKNAEKIKGLGEDAILRLGIDMTNISDIEEFGKIAESINVNWPILENLNPNIDMSAAIEFLTVGPDGKELSSEDVLKNVKNLNAAFKTLNESEDVQAKKEAFIALQTLQNGEEVPAEEYESFWNGLIETFGEGKVENMEADVLNKLYSINTEIEGLENLFMAAGQAAYAKGLSGDEAGMKAELERIEGIKQQISKLKAESLSIGHFGIPSGSGSGGGGGGGGAAQKDFFQQLDASADLSSQQFGLVKKTKGMVSGPFEPEFLQFLQSQGKEAVDLITKNMNKIKAAYRDFVADKASQLAAQAVIAPIQRANELKSIRQETNLRNDLAKEGRPQEEIDYIVDQTMAYNEQIRANDRLIKQEMKKPKGERDKERLEQLRESNRAMERDIKLVRSGSKERIAAEKALEYSMMGPDALLEKYRDNQMEILSLQKQIAEFDILKPLQDQLEVEQKSLDTISRSIELKQREVDGLGRSIELKQRELETLDKQTEQYEEQKEKIEESYDAQFKALDEVGRKEDQLARARQGRLDVASALSRGDVAGAAQAAIAMQQEMAQQRQEETRAGLEAARQRELEVINQKIEEIDVRRKQIQSEIEAIQLQQRDIQDEIYVLEQSRIPIEDKIYDLNEAIKNEAEKLDEKYDDATLAVEGLRAKLEQAKNEAIKLAAARASAGVPETQAETERRQSSTGSLPNQYSLISDKFTYSPTPLFNKYGGKIGKYLMGGRVAFKGSREPAPGMMYGGRMKKYATGSFVPGMGMTDKVPAMLTPGEFVVRKSVAQQYGGLLSGLNSQIFPGLSGAAGSARFNLPGESRYSTRKGSDRALIALATDNSNKNYFVTVNTSSTSDANEIANTVINKIKRSEARNVKGVKL